MPLKIYSSVNTQASSKKKIIQSDKALDEPVDHLVAEDSVTADFDDVNVESDDDDSEFDSDENIVSEAEETQLRYLDLMSAFYAFNPDPSDEQIHSLASALGISKEELEQEIFSIMSVMISDENPKDLSEVAKELTANDEAQWPPAYIPNEGGLDGEPETDNV